MNRAENVIVDLDGTLADCSTRLHYIKDMATGEMLPKGGRQWDKFHEAGCDALVIPHVRQVVQELARYHRIHIVTGRTLHWLSGTRTWLYARGIPYSTLSMRSEADFRPDTEYKAGIFRQWDPADVLCILEDRDGVVKMARDLGYTVFQVNRGAF